MGHGIIGGQSQGVLLMMETLVGKILLGACIFISHPKELPFLKPVKGIAQG